VSFPRTFLGYGEKFRQFGDDEDNNEENRKLVIRKSSVVTKIKVASGKFAIPCRSCEGFRAHDVYLRSHTLEGRVGQATQRPGKAISCGQSKSMESVDKAKSIFKLAPGFPFTKAGG